MGSILPGYQYDIFISYRQKDNLPAPGGEGWVTEFVQALKNELEATFKETISVYFDANPHDGLLDTHDVDDSLKEKVKCRVFIPIISRTYCDPKSFAWSKEFIPFIEFTKNDDHGMKVKLSNGNVASRVLPVRIHDLDKEDTVLFEQTTGSVMRGVDFVYSEAGINRPLKQTDNKKDNLYKTNYHNQVNKASIAIKEIISSMNSQEKEPSTGKKNIQRTDSPGRKKTKPKMALWITLATIISLSAAIYLIFPSTTTSVEDPGEVSIAVLPFDDMSPDGDQEYFSEGLSEELRNALTKQSGLRVMGRTSSFSFKGKESDVKVIGEELGVSTVLEGSVRKSGNTLRITAQLTSTENGFQIWSESYDRELTEIFKVQDEITDAILRELKIHLTGGSTKVADEITTDLSAYELYMQARKKLAMRGKHLYDAIDLFEKVIEIDENYSLAYSGLGRSISLLPSHNGVPTKKFITKTKEAAQKAIDLNRENAEAYSVMGYALAFMEWKFAEAAPFFQRSYEINPSDAEIINFLGDYYALTWHPLAIETEKRAYDLDPLHPIQSNDLSVAYQFVGDYKEVEKYSRISIQLDSFLLQAFDNLVDAYIGLERYDEAEQIVRNYPSPDRFMDLKLKNKMASIHVKKGEVEKAEQIAVELETAAKKEEFFASYMAILYHRLGKDEKVEYWMEKAIERRDYYLIMDWQFTLPERYPQNSAIRKTFDAPELKELFEKRRMNTGN